MLAPIPMIGTAVAVLLAVNLAALQFLAVQPHPDQSFYVSDDLVYLQGTQDQVLRLSGGGITIIPTPTDLLEEPDVLPTRTAMQAFFARQTQMYRILNSSDAEVLTVNGSIPITYHDQPLPGELIFWIQLLVGNLGALVGVAVWAFQRANLAARHFAVTGVGLALSSLAAAVYSSRPLAIDGHIFEMLSYLNYLGVSIFCCGFFCMMLNYPKALTRFVIAPYWYAMVLGVFTLDLAQVLESMDLLRRSPAILTLLLAGVVLYLQWRRSASDPLTRQSLRWFVIVTLSGSGFFIGVIFLPPLFGQDQAISQGLAFLALLTIFVGLAVGVARYPLFDLQQYWVKSMIWLASGLLVIAVNLGIATFFGLSNLTALIMILVSFLLVVVPLKAAGSRYVFNRASSNFQQHLPKIVARMADSGETDVARIWQEQIDSIFSPLEMTREKVGVVRPVVVKRGLGFVVPAIEGNASYHLSYADQGTRLFSSLDVTLIDTLKSLFEMNLSRQHIASEATAIERGRLRKDIHDSLGGRLLSIMHSASDDRVASESRQAISELRDILAAVDTEASVMSAALSTWETQLRTQVESAGIRFEWEVASSLREPALQIAGRDRFNLGQILREAVTNALKHAQPSHVRITFSPVDALLVVTIDNDGAATDPMNWQPGIGTRNMHERAEELGASLSRERIDQVVRCRLVFERALLNTVKP